MKSLPSITKLLYIVLAVFVVVVDAIVVSRRAADLFLILVMKVNIPNFRVIFQTRPVINGVLLLAFVFARRLSHIWADNKRVENSTVFLYCIYISDLWWHSQVVLCFQLVICLSIADLVFSGISCWDKSDCFLSGNLVISVGLVVIYANFSLSSCPSCALKSPPVIRMLFFGICLRWLMLSPDKICEFYFIAYTVYCLGYIRR